MKFLLLIILTVFSLSSSANAECKGFLINENMHKKGAIEKYSEEYIAKDLINGFSVHLSFDFRSPLYQKSLLDKEKINMYVEVQEYSLGDIKPLHKAVVRNYHTKKIVEYWYIYYYNTFIATLSSSKPMDKEILKVISKCEKVR